MVDSEDDEAAAVLARPACRHQRQGVGIPAAREADGQRGDRVPAQPPVEDGVDGVG
jgi:hypothetical protein